MDHAGGALRYTAAGQAALRDLARQRDATRHAMLIAMVVLVGVQALFALGYGPLRGQPLATALLEIDGAMLAAMALLWSLGRAFPVGCAGLGLLGYWTTQFVALEIDAVSSSMFTAELMVKVCGTGLVLREIWKTAALTGDLRGQGLEIAAPSELPEARVRTSLERPQRQVPSDGAAQRTTTLPTLVMPAP